MIQICRKDKEKVFEAIRTGKIDAAEMSFPNLIDDLQTASHRPCQINEGTTAISLLISFCALPLLPNSNARPALQMSLSQ